MSAERYAARARSLPRGDLAALAASGALDRPFIDVQLRAGRSEARGMHHHSEGDLGEAAGGEGGGASWQWDGHSLQACNDRYGFRPLFFWVRAGGIAASPSLVKLLELGAPGELDEPAVAVFLRLGFFVGEDTPFRAIRALPPGGQLEWRGGQPRVTGGYIRTPRSDLARSDAIDAYIFAFRSAVRRSLPARDGCALPLSGGRDSRHILLELCASGAPPDVCITLRNYPPRGAADLAVAANVAKAVGIPHIVLDEDPSRVRAELRKNIETHLCADEHAWFLPLADHVRGRWGTLYDGIAGGVLSAGARLDARRLELARAGRLAEWADSLLDEAVCSRLLTRRAVARFPRVLAVERLMAELSHHAEAPNPVASFIFWNRTRREVALAPFGILGSAARVVTPMLDPEVYDLLASLPAEMFLDRCFHTETIQRAYPEYARLPYATDLPQASAGGGAQRNGAVATYHRRFLRETAAYALTMPRGGMVSRPFVLSRAVAWLATGDFSDTPVMAFALYLMQLERMAGWRR